MAKINRNKELKSALRNYPNLIPEYPLNFNRKDIIEKCMGNFYCKRMTCKRCVGVRRNYFINKNSNIILGWPDATFVTITLIKEKNDHVWALLAKLQLLVSKALTGRQRQPYLRVLAIGKSDTPHVHIVTTFEAIELLRCQGEKLKHRKSYGIEPVYKAEDLLGYLFDQNYLMTYLLHDRPRGMRLATATKGLRVGFPWKSPQKAPLCSLGKSL